MDKNINLLDYWNHVWAARKPQLYKGPIVEAHPLLARFLPKEPAFNFLEIGCIPGDWLVYFHKEYGYKVNGIDYSDAISLTRATCELNEVSATIWHEDVFKFQFPTLFDVVFSQGFIEHFNNWQEALNVHLRWLKPGGYLIIAIPNITGIHKLLMKKFHPVEYSIHYFGIIDQPYRLYNYLSQRSHIIYFGYWITFRPFYDLPKILDFLSRAIQKGLKILGLKNIPNRYFSPYLWIIARKR